MEQIEAAIALDSTSGEPLAVAGSCVRAQGKEHDAIVDYQHAIVERRSDFWGDEQPRRALHAGAAGEERIGPLAPRRAQRQVATFHNNLGMALRVTGLVRHRDRAVSRGGWRSRNLGKGGCPTCSGSERVEAGSVSHAGGSAAVKQFSGIRLRSGSA